MVNIFVTGGAGFVGSHCLVELLQDKSIDNVVVVDNMVNSVMGFNDIPVSLERVEKLTNKKVTFHKLDLLDTAHLRKVFSLEGPFHCVIHFAALKAVGESWNAPLKYYENNVVGSLNLLQVMNEFNCKKLVFSSSSTVYGNPQFMPVTENHPRGNCTNPYGRTKYLMEEMMRDVCQADPSWRAVMLRYFNPLGAHPSGEIGEDAKMPRNLMPWIVKAIKGEIPALPIFGGDWPTKDGTGIRDYTHIMDIAKGHVLAVEKLLTNQIQTGRTAYNFGHGEGYSVLEVIRAVEKVSGEKVPYEFVERRRGDIPRTWADSGKAQSELGWKAERSLEEMCKKIFTRPDVKTIISCMAKNTHGTQHLSWKLFKFFLGADNWKWLQNNPNGYKDQNDKTGIISRLNKF